MTVEQLLWESDATALASHIRSGDLSAGAAVDASIAMIERVNGDLNAVAEGTLHVAERFAKPGVSFESRFASLPEVRCRRLQIAQVLLNLVMNAIEAVA